MKLTFSSFKDKKSSKWELKLHKYFGKISYQTIKKIRGEFT